MAVEPKLWIFFGHLFKTIGWETIVYLKIFVAKPFSCVNFSLLLIIVGQGTWLFIVALITRLKQIFVGLGFEGKAMYENSSYAKIYIYIRPRYIR